MFAIDQLACCAEVSLLSHTHRHTSAGTHVATFLQHHPKIWWKTHCMQIALLVLVFFFVSFLTDSWIGELAKCCYWDVVRAKAVSMRQMSGNNTWPANCMSVPVTSCLTVEQLYAFLPLIRTRHGKFDGILQLAIKILTVGKRQAGSWQLAVLTFRLPKFNSSDNVMRACLAYEGVATFFTLFRETMKKMKLYLK